MSVRSKILCSVLAAFVFVTALSTVAVAKKDDAPKGLKKMIAVVEFEDKSDHSRWHWTGPNPGSGMSDMLVTALVQSGSFSVMEREQLDHVLAEQNLGQSGKVTAQTAPQIGKLLGVAAIVYGSVSEFGYSESSTGGGIAGFGGGISQTTARVAIDVRMIDTTTGQIILAETADADRKQMGLKLRTEDFTFGHDGKFDQTLVGKATREAIDALVESITETLEDVPWTGRIVKASGDKIYLNAGQNTGLTAGMSFNVYRMGEALVDPMTGLELGAEEELIGVIKASDIKEKYSICSVVSGSGFDAGDMVRYE
ncbi:CsgG/HfaB family protein [bacterium]|nr:CsgG/HfaB family protein [bacterium]